LPDIALTAPDGSAVDLAAFAGRKLVLFFYPKDDTPAARPKTRIFPTFRAVRGRRHRAAGVSKDPPKKHEKFIAKHGLAAPLASDAQEGGLSDALGIWTEKSMYGRTYMGMERTTYLVGADGRIAQVWNKVKVKATPRRFSPPPRRCKSTRMTASLPSVAAAIRAAMLTPIRRTRPWPRARWRAPGAPGAWPSPSTWPCPMCPPAPLPELLPPNRMPKRGRGGSERGRIALIHALCHIEFVAIDLALDAAGRFGAERGADFVTDWLGVAADEAMHFGCSPGGCARWAATMAPCPRTTACGMPRAKPRTMSPRGWRWCRWCWKRAAST
jgi:peroxiredoxin Q/BCP